MKIIITILLVFAVSGCARNEYTLYEREVFRSEARLRYIEAQGSCEPLDTYLESMNELMVNEIIRELSNE